MNGVGTRWKIAILKGGVCIFIIVIIPLLYQRTDGSWHGPDSPFKNGSVEPKYYAEVI